MECDREQYAICIVLYRPDSNDSSIRDHHNVSDKWGDDREPISSGVQWANGGYINNEAIVITIYIELRVYNKGFRRGYQDQVRATVIKGEVEYNQAIQAAHVDGARALCARERIPFAEG